MNSKYLVKNDTSKKQCINRNFVILSNLMFNIYLLLIYVGAKIIFCVSHPYQNENILWTCSIWVCYLLPHTNNEIVFICCVISYTEWDIQIFLHCYSYIFWCILIIRRTAHLTNQHNSNIIRFAVFTKITHFSNDFDLMNFSFFFSTLHFGHQTIFFAISQLLIYPHFTQISSTCHTVRMPSLSDRGTQCQSKHEGFQKHGAFQ